MTWFSVLLLLLAFAWVLWWGRRIPLAGQRRRLVLGCRLAAIAALWLALAGWTHRRLIDVPRHLIYLVDGSASMDEAQRAWAARRIASLEALRPKRLERAIVAFGAEPVIVSPFGTEPQTDPARIQAALERAPVNPLQTNLEAALLAAVGLPPSHRPDAAMAAPAGRGGVVLLSDGRETEGSVSGVLAFVQRAGLAVFPTPPPGSAAVKTAWEELAVPPVVQQGAPVRLQLVLVHGGDRTKAGMVTVMLHGVVIKRQRVAIRPGWSVASVSVPAVGRGTMALEVSLAIPDEGVEERRRAYTEVEGPPHLLVVSEQMGTLPAMAAALKRREIAVSVVRPAELPEEPGRLLDYDAVVLFNVPHSTLAPAQGQALQAYIEEFGGGLLTVGLGGELATEVTTPSPIDALLPVRFEPKGLQESKRRVCVVMLVDRSASMYGPRLAATKRAAVELVKQLAPEDLVGILAFDTQPYVVAEVQPAGQVSDWLVDKLVTLRSSGGTDIYPALAAATNRLELTGATVKHIILLSDGNTPIHEQAYQALIESFRRNGTTVSTIGIGAAFVNTEYLKWLANATGGRYHAMRNLDELPQLIARDMHQELGRLPFTEGRFRPTRGPAAEWFAEIPEWPALRGYLTATAKPEARVELTVNGGDGDDPLLARWAVGHGRVATFLSDGDRRWAPEWIRWPAFEGVWAQVARWVMRPRLTEELFVWMDEHGGDRQLVIEGTLQHPQAELIAAEGAGRLPLSLVQSGPWRWRAPLADAAGGWYQLALASRAPETGQAAAPDDGRNADGAVIFAKRWVRLGAAAASQEVAGQPPRESVLRAIASATGGAYAEPDRALVPPTAAVHVREPWLAWWLPLVLVALLIEVWLRGPSML